MKTTFNEIEKMTNLERNDYEFSVSGCPVYLDQNIKGVFMTYNKLINELENCFTESEIEEIKEQGIWEIKKIETTKKVYLNKDLVVGNKYTIVKMEGFTPYSVNFTLVDYSFRNFAQYEDCLRLEVRFKRHRSNDIIWITPSDIVLIKEGWHNIDVYNRELIEDNEKVTMSRLHKINIEDFKNDKDTILYKPFRQGLYVPDYDYLLDVTGDYICNNNIKPIDAPNNEGYIDYIKSIIKKFNTKTIDRIANDDGMLLLKVAVLKAIA